MVKIRKAKREDLKEISELVRIEYAKPPYNEKWSKKTATKKVNGYFKDCEIFVIPLNNKIIGFIIGRVYLSEDGKKGYINELIVSSRFQGDGYGRLLLDFYGEYLKRKNVKDMELMANLKSKAFKVYKKIGFKELNDFIYMTKKIK